MRGENFVEEGGIVSAAGFEEEFTWGCPLREGSQRD